MSQLSQMTNPDDKKWMRPFFSMWVGQIFSMFGSNLVQFAMVWWLTSTTQSATVLATATLVALLPGVFISPFAGALVDRWNRKVVMIVADAFSAVMVLVLVYLFYLNVTQPWHIYVVMFFRSLAGQFQWPAMQASISLMVPEKHLARIGGLNSALGGAIGIISPPVGAFLLGVLPMFGVLAVDIVTATIAIGVLFFIHIPQPQIKDIQPVSIKLMVKDVGEGLRYVRAWPGIMAVGIIATLINFLVIPAFSLLPLLVTKEYGGGVWHYGLMDSAWGFGIIAGGLILSAWRGTKKKIYTSLGGIIGMGLGIILVGTSPANLFLLAVIGIIVTGLMNPIANGPLFAILQAKVAPEMQGRVFSLIGSFASAMSPLGMIIAGPVADAFGVRTWFILGGISCILMGFVGMFIPVIIHLENNGNHASAGVEITNAAAE
jgi:DHA3 family macrolide efflux protein-like MFS transporter